MMVVSITALLSGCGKAVNPLESAMKDADNSSDIPAIGPMKDYAELAATQEKIQKSYDANDPEAAAKMMDAYAQFGAKMELQEFEKAEALDAPSDFPAGLIFEKGKITSASENGDESYINKSIVIETTESLKTVKDFYKNLFSQLTWKLTSQSSDGSGASYEATDSAGIGASVSINSPEYSKIVSISISYSGSITE